MRHAQTPAPHKHTHRPPEEDLHHRLLLVPQASSTDALKKGDKLGVSENLHGNK
jgi:hypothetical protein